MMSNRLDEFGKPGASNSVLDTHFGIVARVHEERSPDARPYTPGWKGVRDKILVTRTERECSNRIGWSAPATLEKSADASLPDDHPRQMPLL